MLTFWGWLSQAGLLAETYFSFNPQAYNQLFDDELEKVIARVRNPRSLEHLRGFDWLAYVSSWVRHAGFRDHREVQERTHDIVTKLLTGTLFRGYDPLRHGPMELGSEGASATPSATSIQKERNRRRLIPTMPIAQEFTPGSVTPDDLPAKAVPEDDRRRSRGSGNWCCGGSEGWGLPCWMPGWTASKRSPWSAVLRSAVRASGRSRRSWRASRRWRGSFFGAIRNCYEGSRGRWRRRGKRSGRGGLRWRRRGWGRRRLDAFLTRMGQFSEGVPPSAAALAS